MVRNFSKADNGRPPAPNDGHHACVALERAGKLALLATQNVDGLHQAAGTSPKRIVEVHGRLHSTRCLSCRAVGPVEPVLRRVDRGEQDPRCGACGGALKADVILFGEVVDNQLVEQCYNAATECDLVIAVGTTLAVTPINEIVPLALQRGKKLIIVNAGAGAFDDQAT
eukprot:894690-Prymnesium_polylepis.1